jgi:hypothetical protein
MPEGSWEKLGFVCRWSLLGLACLTGLAAGWAGALAATTVGTSLSASVTFPDALCPIGTGGNFWMKGYTGSVQPYKGRPAILWSSGAGASPALGNWIGRLIPTGRIEPGLYHVRATGIPYSCLAFESRDLLVLGVPAGRKVFVIDARWAFALPPEEYAALGELLTAMRRTGEAAFFHPGGLEEFTDLREKSRRDFPDVPIICCGHPPKGPDTLFTLYDITGGLGRSRTEQSMFVVTADPGLAFGAAKDGRRRFFVHFIGPADPRFQPKLPLRVHASLANFKEFLAAEPMSK